VRSPPPSGDQTLPDRPRDEEDDGLYRTFSRARAAVWDRTGPVYDADERQARLAAMPTPLPLGTLPYEVWECLQSARNILEHTSGGGAAGSGVWVRVNPDP